MTPWCNALIRRTPAPLLLTAVAALLHVGSASAQVNEVQIHPKVKKPQTATLQTPPSDAAHFSLAARITLSQGFVKEAAWLNNDDFITLVVRPDGAQVLRFSYETLRREKFLSSDFIEKYLSGSKHADRLSWRISPARNYLFFSWVDDSGQQRWQLVDISGAPDFRLRSFIPPGGMKIDRVLFSPDDRYAVFFHDSYVEGSPVTALVMDLKTGTEIWRIGSAELGFIMEAWWDGAVFDEPRFQATATLHDGQFLKQPGLAKCDVRTKKIDFTSNSDRFISGASGVWGQVWTMENHIGGKSPFVLLVSQPDNRQTLPLTSVPAQMELLADPGLILLANEDKQNNVAELWLVDAASGRKYMVDGDCAGFAVSANGRLLVRAEQSNELRIYDFVKAGAGQSDSVTGEPREKLAPGGKRNPDEWIPH